MPPGVRPLGLEFPLLADFEPKGAVARAYGVYRAADGTSERALFVIDGKGVIRWSYVAPDCVNPGADGVLTALDAIQPGGGGVRGRRAHPGGVDRTEREW